MNYFKINVIELIAVGQNVAALQSLHEIVISKRSRNTPLVALEPIMLRFVELCVNLRKGKTAKEGLHQYKNISQNTSVTTIEVSELYSSPSQVFAEKQFHVTTLSNFFLLLNFYMLACYQKIY